VTGATIARHLPLALAGHSAGARLAGLLAPLKRVAIGLVLPSVAAGAPASSKVDPVERDRVVTPDQARRFRERMLPHLHAAHNLARFLSRDADAAQDIVQEAVLRALRGFDAYRGDGDRAWLLAIVRNCHLDWRSRTARMDRTEPLFDEESEEERADLPAAEETPEKSLLRHEEARRVRRQLESMPEAYREVLVLRELEDLSYREIADATGLPIGTVMSRLARARALFQKAWTLAEAGGETAS
jgi:RNA polymerase sigma factor (sigma-70 family)